MKNALFIINPRAGREGIRPVLLSILNTFTAAGLRVTTHVTQCRGDAKAVAQEQGGEYDLLICCGGDGTLDEVVSGVVAGGHHCQIGYIPAGSTNDFAQSLRLPGNMEKAAQVVAEGAPFDCDVGDFNGASFIYVSAFGVFTEVSYKTAQDMKNVLGHLAYVIEGAKSLLSIKSYRMRFVLDDEVVEGDFLYGMITNSESVGGVKGLAGHDVRLDDGKFEVVLLRHPASPEEWESILGGLLEGQLDEKLVVLRHVSRVEVESEPVAWTLDGEDGGTHKQAQITVHQKRVTILTDGENPPQ